MLTAGILFAVGVLLAQTCAMRGRPFHNRLVVDTAQAGESAGWCAAVECARLLPDGRLDFVDVWLTRGPAALAVEVETTPRYVAVNVAKAAALAVPLWIVVPDRRVRTAVARLPAVRLLRPAGRDIWILLPDEVPQALTTMKPFVYRGE